jgi:hypothetical protein
MSSTDKPRNDSWNSFTVPWKLTPIVAGIRSSRTASFTRAAASPSEKPGRRLNETVIAGSCPKWLTVSGPTLRETFTSESSGTSAPPDERT